MSKLRVSISGVTGKMGSLLARHIKDQEGNQLSFVGGWSRTTPLEEINEICQASDVIIDFSQKENIEKLLTLATNHMKPLVI
jgi:dihydrodipicolinate reductase